MNSIVLVGVGGAIGAILRYVIGGWAQSFTSSFPLGTLVVNVMGSFLISIVLFGTEFQGWFSDDMRIFLAIGIMGSFTTMSSFNYESFKLGEQGELMLAFLSLLGNYVGGLLAIFLGRSLILSIGK